MFSDDLVSIEKWRPNDTGEYNFQYPFDEANIKPDQYQFMTPEYYATQIGSDMHEGIDPPIAFGQHANAEISAQIGETIELLESIVSL